MALQVHAGAKTAVSAALVRALSSNRFRDWLSPEDLARMVEQRFDVLFADGTLDLSPLWDALAAAYNPQALVGLFLRFEEEARRIPVQVRMPPIFGRLSSHQKESHVRHFDLVADLAPPPDRGPAPRPSDLTPLPTLEELTVAAEPIPLSPENVKPIIPEALKRRVVQAVVQCVKGSPVGWRVNSAQLRSVVTESFDKLCDGIRFDFEPVARALRRDKAIDEGDIYVAAVRLIEQLRRMNVVMAEPKTTLGEAARARLWEEAMSGASESGRAPSDIQYPQNAPPVRLGDLLLKYQLINEQQLEQALRAQAVSGGKLGTNLVELGFIAETALSHFLSVQLGLPAVSPSKLEKIPPEVIAVLPLEVAKKHRVVPLSADKRVLELAMADPTDLAIIDEVSFLTGHRVRPKVAPEVLIGYALELYYGIPRQPRRTADAKALAVAPAEEEFQVVQTSTRRRKKRTEEAEGGGGIIIEERGHFLDVDRDDFSKGGTSVDDLTRELALASDTPSVHHTLLRFASRLFSRAAVLTLDGSELVGVAQHGCRISDELIATLRFPLEESELFRRIYARLDIHVGPVPASPRDDWLMSTLGITPGTPVVCLPLGERQRLTSFLLAAERRSQDPYREVKLYGRLTEKVNLAFQVITLKAQLLDH